MASVLWTGDNLSFFLKFVMNINSILAWITGSARDGRSMKQNMKLGFEGALSDDVKRYDEVGMEYFSGLAGSLLDDLDCSGRRVLDVGCGTGILSFSALERGAAHVTMSDISDYMLGVCRNKIARKGLREDRVACRTVDAEMLDFNNESFDAVVSNMVLGLVPEQDAVVGEMVRVAKSGGTVALTTHGPHIWREPFNAGFMAVLTSRYLLDLVGYRIEFWPRCERDIVRIFEGAGLKNVSTRRLVQTVSFENPDRAYDFFSSVSASWWNAVLDTKNIRPVSELMRNAFRKGNITRFTEDVIFAKGEKP